MDDHGDGGWTVTSAGRAGRVEVTLDVGPRPLRAQFTDEEFENVRSTLDDAVEAARRNEYSRIKLRDGLRAAIGHDPFTTVPHEDAQEDPGMFPVWLGIIFTLFGLGFAIRNTNIWLQIMGCAFAAVTLADVVRHGVRYLRGRRA